VVGCGTRYDGVTESPDSDRAILRRATCGEGKAMIGSPCSKNGSAALCMNEERYL
jgi:hypothetical protein